MRTGKNVNRRKCTGLKRMKRSLIEEQRKEVPCRLKSSVLEFVVHERMSQGEKSERHGRKESKRMVPSRNEEQTK